ASFRRRRQCFAFSLRHFVKRAKLETSPTVRESLQTENSGSDWSKVLLAGFEIPLRRIRSVRGRKMRPDKCFMPKLLILMLLTVIALAVLVTVSGGEKGRVAA